jgi:hypothetical protein
LISRERTWSTTFDRCFIGDALALDEVCLQAGSLHGARDRLAATVDDDRVDTDRFEENDISGDTVADFRIR